MMIKLYLILASCVAISHGFKCYQCEVGKDGQKCGKPEEEYLKICPELKEVAKRACLAVFSQDKEGLGVENSVRSCSTKPETDPPGCADFSQGDRKKEVKKCTCYESGCNKQQSPYSKPDPTSTANTRPILFIPYLSTGARILFLMLIPILLLIVSFF